MEPSPPLKMGPLQIVCWATSVHREMAASFGPAVLEALQKNGPKCRNGGDDSDNARIYEAFATTVVQLQGWEEQGEEGQDEGAGGKGRNAPRALQTRDGRTVLLQDP